jgi:glycosyltransferase involved in cell wall biosynthesis
VIRVLTSYRVPTATTNPYVVQLNRALIAEPDLTVANFSFREALLGRYDVFHVHWAETLFNARSAGRRFLKQLLFAVLLARLRLTRVPVVWTAHNLANHESLDPFGAWLVRGLRARVRLYIRINAYDGEGVPEPSVVILHGHYRDWFAQYPQPEAVPGRIVFFGLVRPYKGVEDLIAAFADVHTDGLTLQVSGRPLNAETAAELARLAEPDPRVRLDLRFLEESELVALVSSAELVVLPYREMYNSGSLLAALSLGKPVLVPQAPVNELVAAEVGPEWVMTYPGSISAGVIESAVVKARELPLTDRPNLDQREWDLTGKLHAGAYRRAIDGL